MLGICFMASPCWTDSKAPDGKILSDFRYVRRKLFHQLYRRLSAGCRPRLVYVLGNAAKPLLLVFRFRVGRPFGSLIQLNTKGLDFVMTAIFIVIFLEQWLKEKHYDTALIGIGLSALCLAVFGRNDFLLPAMSGILSLLLLLRHPLEKAGYAN